MSTTKTSTIVAITTAAFIITVLALMIGLPQYKVWQKDLNGQATLAEAEWDRQVAIAEAKAREESAVYDKRAKIIDAEAIAEANYIIGQSLQDNPEYLRYVWLTRLGDENVTTVYVATENGFPVMEATRLP